MTKERKVLILVIIVLILLIGVLSYFLINKNAIIKKQAEKIELQAMEINGSNSYTTTQEHLNETSQNKVIIPSLYLEGSTYVYTGNSGSENMGCSGNTTTSFKLNCSKFKHLKIGSISGSVTIKLTDSTNNTTSITANTNEIDISNYVLIEISANASNSLGSGYRHDASISYSAKLTNIEIY